MTTEVKQQTKKKFIGLCDYCTNHLDWKYIAFYDIDFENEKDPEYVIRHAIMIMDSFDVPYLIYTTKNGMHIIVLSPLPELFKVDIVSKLKYEFPNYYSGRIIRLTLKADEKRELVTFRLMTSETRSEKDHIIKNLYNIFRERDFPQLPDLKEGSYPFTSAYRLVFQTYWSKKI